MTQFQFCFWVSDTGEKPLSTWIKALTTTDRIYLGDLLRDLAHSGPRPRPKVFKHLEGLL